ncbi:MAG: hypothetical protein LUQ07_06740 [Methanospirillum sp.]|nr:hypothetical protein [Methanospirillum sp.]
MKGSTGGIFFFSLLIITSISIVSAVPPLPAEYYGNVLIDGSPAPAGTVVTILMQNIPKGSLTTEVPGFYGGPGLFDPRLKINATEEEYKAGNLTVSFQINGVPAARTILFEPGSSQQFDLSTGGQDGQNVPVTGVTPVPAQINSLETRSLVSDNNTPVYQVSGNYSATQNPPGNGTFGYVVSGNYSSPVIPPAIDANQPSYQAGSAGSSFSPAVNYGLEKEKRFVSDDGIASLLCEKDTLLFSPSGQFLHDVSVKSRGIADLPPVASDKPLRFSGYAYDITPERIYLNPEGVFTIHIPLERMADIGSMNPQIYEYVPQTATWSQIKTNANNFTGNISGTIYEGAVYALFLADASGTTTRPQTGGKEMQEPGKPAISRVNSTAGAVSSPVQPAQVQAPVKTVTLVPSAPNLTGSAEIAPNNATGSELPPSSATPVPTQEKTPVPVTNGSGVSPVQKMVYGPVGIVTGVILLVILVNLLAYLLYTRWWLKRS